MQHVHVLGLQLAQARALRIERDVPHRAAARLVDAREAQVSRVLHRVGGVAADELHQHGVEQLRAGAHHDARRVHFHPARAAQIGRDGLAQAKGALGRRGRERLGLVF